MLLFITILFVVISASPRTARRWPWRLQIHPDLQSLIPPLTPEEYAQLEANLLADGCLTPLIVWQETETVLDGHNRLAICERHGVPYRTQALSLPDLEAAKAWLIAHQLGRRNLTPNQMSYLQGKQYLLQKQQGKRTDLTSGKSCQKSPPTAGPLARQHQVSEKTIRNHAVYAQAVDTLAAAVGLDPHQTVLARETKVTQQDVKALAKMAKQHALRAKEALDAAQEAKTPKQARQIVREKAREVREYEQYMAAMMRSELGEEARARPAPPEVQQRAWDEVYEEKLARLLTTALRSLEALHRHLLVNQDGWLETHLPAVLERQLMACRTLAQQWGVVEQLFWRAESLRTLHLDADLPVRA